MAGEHILVVEGNPTRGQTLALILKDIGSYETSHAPTVLAAIQMIQATAFEMLMINTTVQKENDGLKLSKLLLLRLEKTKRPLTMTVTPQAEKALVQQAARVGVVDFVIYPYDPEALLQRVRTALSQRADLTDDQVRKGDLGELGADPGFAHDLNGLYSD